MNGVVGNQALSPTGEVIATPADALRVFNPPGGLMIWLFIALELFTFCGGFAFYLIARNGDPELFKTSQALLHRGLATFNTLLLITSSFVVAQGVVFYKMGRNKPAALRMAIGALLGVAFLGCKSWEYIEKLAAGHRLGSDSFFTYYWILTGFHFVHVMIGVGILLMLTWQIGRGRTFRETDFGVQTGAAFWHLCDLIWVVLFPLIYFL